MAKRCKVKKWRGRSERSEDSAKRKAERERWKTVLLRAKFSVTCGKKEYKENLEI
jgi:hypothetical protein